ncbi:MAG: DUF6807 family protein [Phycisphaerae bacterium]
MMETGTRNRLGNLGGLIKALIGLLSVCIGCMGPSQRISGVVPTDWPADLLMPVEVPLPTMPAGTSLGAVWANRLLVRVSVGGRPATFQPADLGQTDPFAPCGQAILRMCLKLNESDRGQTIEILLPDRLRAQAVGCCSTRYEEPFLHLAAGPDRPMLSYWHGPADLKNTKRYPLNDFIHPVIGLDGEELTAASPGDHIHHRGIFWAWVRTERQGQWQNEWWIPREFVAEPGRLEHDADGTTSCRFTAEHFWTYRPADPARKERFVRETVDCRLYCGSASGRALDIDLTLTALVDGIRIGGQTAADKGYGGMTCRFGSATEVRMENDQGPISADSLNHVVARWVDWTGRFIGPDGQRLPHRSGAALMVHPSHPTYPPEWIVRAYGPIGVAYPGLEMMDLHKDKPLHLRYRLWIHRGDAIAGKVPEAYQAYIADWKWKTG